MKPEFICIGAQKAGTTWLHANLQRHPDFAMPPVKELHYFDRASHYASADHLTVTRFRDRWADKVWRKKMVGDIWRPARSLKFAKARWWSRFHFADFSDEWYLSLFSDCRGITGDVSPSYTILDEEDVARMHRLLPDARLILLIRDPVDRAWSMFRYLEQFGFPLDLDDIDTFRTRVDAPQQDRRSDYRRALELFLRYYPPDQLLVGFFDAIREDPEGLLGAVCQYLGAAAPAIEGGSLRKEVNRSRRQDSCPPEFRGYLERKYRPLMEWLADRFDGYAARWLVQLDGGEIGPADGIAPVRLGDGSHFVP